MKSIFLAFLVLHTILLHAQYEDTIPEFRSDKRNSKTSKTNGSNEDFDEKFFKRENIIIGTSFQLSIGNSNQGTISYLGLAPSLGYRLIKEFETGMYGGYYYLGNFSNFNQHNLFIGPYIKFYPIQSYFIQAEGIYSNYSDKFLGGNSLSYGNFLLGIGYNNELSEYMYVSAGIKINIIPNAPYFNGILPQPFLSVFWRLKPKQLKGID